ncbi:hypothetical protein AX16_001894, partial [Volvariella volvacea WC 439]
NGKQPAYNCSGNYQVKGSASLYCYYCNHELACYCHLFCNSCFNLHLQVAQNLCQNVHSSSRSTICILKYLVQSPRSFFWFW